MREGARVGRLGGIGVAAGPIRLFVNGLILLLVILFLPNGLASLFSRTHAPAPVRTEAA